MRMFATPAAAAAATACVHRRSSWAHGVHLVAVVSQQFPCPSLLSPPTSIHPSPFGSIPFERLTHRAGFFQGNGKIPHPNPQSPQRDDVIVFGCQSTARSLSHAGIASNLSLGVAPFTLQEAGNRLHRLSLARSLCEMHASGRSLSCPRKNQWPIFDLGKDGRDSGCDAANSSIEYLNRRWANSHKK